MLNLVEPKEPARL